MLQKTAFLLLLLAHVWAAIDAKTLHRLELDELWTSFKETYSKLYEDDIEDAYRLKLHFCHL